MWRRVIASAPLAGVLLFLAVLAAQSGFAADLGQWAEGRAKHDGASKDYYNRAARLPWRNKMGDWVDATGKPQGSEPLARAVPVGRDQLEFDLSELVRQWYRSPDNNRGILLKTLGGRAVVLLHSREVADAARRPQLIVTTDQGVRMLDADADTYLDRATYKSTGREKILRIGGAKSLGLIRFDLSAIPAGHLILDAKLRVTIAKHFGKPPFQIGVFLASPAHGFIPQVPLPGLASGEVDDRGLVSHPDVVYFSQFEDNDWLDKIADKQGEFERVEQGDDTAEKFVPLDGDALRVTILKGKHFGLNASYFFAEQTGREPESIYFRYYLRLADNWHTASGGKLPGIAGTYKKAGWGGRGANGRNGWSARGLFEPTVPAGNPAAGRTPIGSYVYHADGKSKYGTSWHWSQGQRGVLERNRWYCIEHYVKLNTPGQNDGVLRGWVDGRLAFERTDIRFRDIPDLKIERVWLNVFYGGTSVAKQDASLYIDNLAISRRYIGPMARGNGSGAASMDWWMEAR